VTQPHLKAIGFSGAVRVALNCGAEDAELMAREIGINPKDIQSLKPFNTSKEII
jgi:hypothetical protein